MDDAPESPKQPRWKLLAIMLAVPILLWVVSAKTGVLDSGFDGILAFLLLILLVLMFLIWLIAAGRVSLKGKAIGLAAILLFNVLFRYDGLSGGFFPHFVFRWSVKPATDMPTLAGKMESAGEALPAPGPSDYPRFLGAEMTNWVPGDQLAADWFENPPKELWRKQIGEGWASFSVYGDYAFTMEQRGEKEVLVCYELGTGDAVWAHAEDVRFEEGMGGDGPRTTPTVADGRVFALGATGILNCHDLRSGEKLWGKNVLEEAGHKVPMWAKSSSPLVADGKVIVTLGEQAKGVAAYDVATGELVWRGGDDGASYSSPVLATIGGQEQIVAILKRSVRGLSLADGSELWSFPIGNPQGNCASPRIVGDRVVTSAGYGYGSHLIEVTKNADGFEAEGLWRSKDLKAKFADFVVRGEYIYGLSEKDLVCITLEDGLPEWEGKQYGYGQMLGVGEHLIIQSEKGKVYVVEASPDGEEIVSEFRALGSKTWNHPVLAGRILLVRNDREAIAFEYPGR